MFDLAGKVALVTGGNGGIGLGMALGLAQAGGVPTAIYYPKPLHVQSVFAHLGHAADDMPVSASLSRRILSLPMHPYLEESDQDRICQLIAAYRG